MKKPTIPLSLNFAILALFWTLFIIALAIYDFHGTKETSLKFARIQALTGLEKDIIYRKWNAINGGVYGSVSDITTPNSYLTGRERDIVTPSGERQLTLINPAYMTRQVHELEHEKNGVVGHITSLMPIRPENKADEWETRALKQFETGVQEVSGLEILHGREYFRVMRPLMVTGACLPCHATQGYKVGEVRGGLSISVPMKQWFEHREEMLQRHRILLAAVWAVVLAGLYLGFFNLQKKVREGELFQADLNKLKNVLEQINDSVLTINPTTLCFTYANQAAINASGYSQVELEEMSLGDLGEGDSLQLFDSYVEKLIHNPEKIFHFESRFVHRSGKAIPVDLQLQYLKLDQDTELIVVVLRDISSRKEHEKKQQEMLAHLQRSQKLESVGLLASGIAHEINTPVQYIGANLDFLAENFTDVGALIENQQRFIESDVGKGSAAYGELVEVINELDWGYLKEEIPQAVQQSLDGVRQISSIVLAMKDFSHPGSEEKAPADVNQLIQTIVTVARNEWKSVAEVRLELTEKRSAVVCRPNEISQVLLNIIVNAAHAIGDLQQQSGDFGLGLISITTTVAGDFFIIRIEDNGCGIPKAIVDSVFDPFFTTKEVGKGTGQGLAIAHDIITKKHHGSLEVESEERQGTIFSIHLPFDGREQTNLNTVGQIPSE